jgi:serine/threonine protein kinase
MDTVQKKLKSLLTPFLIDDAVEVGEIKRGAYSSVVKVRWQGTEFRGKKLHDLPLRLEKKKSDEILSKLKKHCEVFANLQHPNIVQYVGITLSTADAAPILMNELMADSVASLLKSHTRFPLPVQLSILQDVAQGLAFLHCNYRPLVHGNMHANNVLLSRGLQAKLSDVGVAGILETSSNKMTVNPSKSPEIACYIPPEASGITPGHPSADIFSYGVLMLHILYGSWPIPFGDPKQAKEIDRRKKYIDSIPPSHCLMSLLQDCLRNVPGERPHALNLVERLTRLTSQDPLPFKNALELMLIMERREGELVSMVDQLRAGQEEVKGIGRQLNTYDLQLAAVKEEVKKMEEKVINGLSTDTKQSAVNIILNPPIEADKLWSAQDNSTTNILTPTQSVFHWKRGPSAPIGMNSATAIVLEGKLYLGGGETGDIQKDRILYEYDVSGMVHKWTSLPTCPVAYFALGVVNKSMVLVGGIDANRKTSNKLYMWDRDKQEWSITLPPMSISRQNPTVASHNLSLIVAGGYKSKQVLSDVEAFDQSTFQWIRLANLLVPTAGASSCVIRNVLYVMGGSLHGESGASTVVQAISLSGDLSSAVWCMVSNCPLTKICAVPSSSFLLGVGGCMPGSDTPTNKVHAYFPELDKWQYLCDMPTSRNKCVAAVLSAGRMIVIGGKEGHIKTEDYGTTVEMLTV